MTSPEVIFTLAHGQNAFFEELADALAWELRRVGVSARLVVGDLPDPQPDRVHVLLPPHEFVALTGVRPPAAILRRCLLVSAEQPSSEFFPGNLDMARDAGAVFDINPRGVRAYRECGIAAEHIQLGYTEAWDRHALAPERDIDVLFLGRLTARRELALASYADVFERLRCHLLISDNSRPNTGSGPGFATGEDKRRLLARAKVLLNIHGEDEPYFEWLRVAEAICCGCVVVSEHSTDIAPLRWGEHMLTGRVETLGLLAATVVDDAGMRQRIGADAREHLRSEAPLSAAAERLRAAAERVAASPVDPTAARIARIARMRMERAADVADRPRQPEQPAGISPGEGLALRAIKQQLLQLTALRRQIAAESLARDRPEHPTPRTVRVEVSRGWTAAAVPAVSVIVPVYNHADSVRLALDSLLRSTRRDWEVVVVDDGSTDGSGEAVQAWIAAYPEHRALLVQHEINRGLPHARNTGIAHARADLLLMLDSDNVLRRFAIARLAEALENEPEASFAYGILDRFSDDGPEGLLSFYDWDPERLREGNYIDALALIRRAALDAMGGYTGDPRLFGWEDYDLWARLAEAGHHGAFVPEIIARYRVGHGSMISLTNLSTTDAYAALADHAPQLMRGLQPPGISAGPNANGAAASRSATVR